MQGLLRKAAYGAAGPLIRPTEWMSKGQIAAVNAGAGMQPVQQLRVAKFAVPDFLQCLAEESLGVIAFRKDAGDV
jgi:hypothetical protein